ncbi:chitobiase/beta-hexosaminidase C-terminal domain-containing protein [Candidatus Methanomassiliicoccus intestinalis]|uniref:chitobiase/beta-hexosaminidase C-terminal domain-containing protein n=1 Tax=Candidatus Methanomassiliicoccus intestinalis TaxID=1406512 RepID=UPI0037DD7BC4
MGVYIGGGYAVEERGFNYGCVKTRVSSRNWTHWYKLPFIDYGEGAANVPATEHTLGSRLLKKGTEGSDVKALQEALMKLGYELPDYGADGEFGEETKEALMDFQRDEGLDVDGEYGEKSHAALMDALSDEEAGNEDGDDETDTPAEPEEPKPLGVTVAITGGSVQGTMGRQPTDGNGKEVYPLIANLLFLGNPYDNSGINGLKEATDYGMNGVTTDSNGKLYLWLPEGTKISEFTNPAFAFKFKDSSEQDFLVIRANIYNTGEFVYGSVSTSTTLKVEIWGYGDARAILYTGNGEPSIFDQDSGKYIDTNVIIRDSETGLYAVSSGVEYRLMLDSDNISYNSINPLPEGYRLVGLYLNPQNEEISAPYRIDEAFIPGELKWGSGLIYGGDSYKFTMPNADTRIVVVVIKDGESGIAPAITSDLLMPVGYYNTPFTYQLSATGDQPITWKLKEGSELPPGLMLDKNTGLISGTPTKYGEFDGVYIVATNSAGSHEKFFNFLIAGIKLAAPIDPVWDTTTPAKATWQPVTNATGYSVQLYRGGTEIDNKFGEAVTVTGTSYDFTQKITSPGRYYFKVQALGDDTTYLNSEEALSNDYYKAPDGKPTGEIKMGNKTWKSFSENIPFDLFINETQTIEILVDGDDETVTVEYYLSDKAMTQVELGRINAHKWVDYTGPFTVTAEKHIIYAKLQDAKSRSTYLSSEGIIIDKTPPLLEGAEDNHTYNAALTITVSDDHLQSVLLNEEEQSIDGSSTSHIITLNTNGTYTIKATDKAGNETTITVTIAICNLTAIENPNAITGIANGTNLTEIVLPQHVNIQTTVGQKSATVKWDLSTANPAYDPSKGDKQTFIITGKVTLPGGVTNHESLPLTVEISITVEAKTEASLSAIEIITNPAKLEYIVGEALDLTGLQVKLSYDNDTNETVDFAHFSEKGIATSLTQGTVLTLADKSVIVYAGGKSVSFEITVKSVQQNQVATPVFTPSSGTYDGKQNVAITCATDGATIYYTIDGIEPTIDSTIYTDVITIEKNTIIKAIAVKDGMTSSAIATASYIINYQITATAGEGGSIDPAGEVTVESGNDQTFIITANNGYNIKDVIVDGLSVGKVSSYEFKNVNADHTIAVEFEKDITLPTGKITIGDNTWIQLMDEPTFNLFFKDAQDITITAEDDSGKVVTIQYYFHREANALTENDLNNLKASQWKDYEKFSIQPDDKLVIYAKLTDHARNVTYLSSNGIVLDKTPPAFSIAEGTYTEAQAITVSDNYALASVLQNNMEQLTNDSSTSCIITLSTNGTYVIKATDKAGNEAAITVTIKLPNLTKIESLEAIEVANGTPLDEINLPKQVTITTTNGNKQVDVIWDLENVNGYNPSSEDKQTFIISGEVKLLDGVTNTNNVSLEVTISVTVKALPLVETPTISLVRNSQTNALEITITCATKNAAIYYTLDGSEPTVTSDVYKAPIEIKQNTTIKAIAVKENMKDSEVAEESYTLHTINATAGSGGSISPSGEVTVESGESLTFTITANSNYRINEILVDDKSVPVSSTYTFEKVTDNHTIQVSFAYIGSSGPSTPPVDPPVKPPIDPEPEPEPVIPDENGNAEIKVDEEQAEELINNAVDSGSATIELIDSNNTEGELTSVTVSTTDLQTISDKLENHEQVNSVSITTSTGTIVVEQEVLADILESTDAETVSFAVNDAKDKLTEEQKQAVGNNPVFEINIHADDQKVTSFNGKTITISLPYELKEGEDPNNIIIYHLKDDGTIEKMKCVYHDGQVSFETNHLSMFFIAYEAAEPVTPDQPDDNKSDNIIYYILAAIVVIILIVALAYYFLQKKQ